MVCILMATSISPAFAGRNDNNRHQDNQRQQQEEQRRQQEQNRHENERRQNEERRHHKQDRDNNGNIIGVIIAGAIIGAIINDGTQQNQTNIVAQGSMPYGTVTMIQIESCQFADVNYANGAYERIYGPRRAYNVVNYTISQQ
jgi:hypothetical protein